MLHLLKAEFEYHKISFVCAGILVFLLFTVVFFLGMNNVYGLMAMTMPAYWVMLGIIGSRMDKEKRDRLYTLLPVSLKHVSSSRLLFWILSQCAWFICWLIVYFAVHLGEDSWTIWSMLAMNAFVLIAVAPFSIYHDLAFYHKATYRVFFWGVLLTIFGLIVFLAITTDFERAISYGPQIRKTPWHAVWYIVIGLILIELSYFVFLKRRSYVA